MDSGILPATNLPKRVEYSFAFKHKVAQAAEKTSIHHAAREYNVDRMSVRRWMIKQTPLSAVGSSKRKRLDGAGRMVKNPELEEALHKWVLQERDAKRAVSRSVLLPKVTRMAHEAKKHFCKSDGWGSRFMARKRLSTFGKTTVFQKPSADYIEKMVDFVLFIRDRRKQHQYLLSAIYGRDKTAVSFDMASDSTLEETGSREVAVKTTGHEKLRITVMLMAKADGSKLKPFVLLNRRRPLKELGKFRGQLVLKYEGTTWMTDALTISYIRDIIGSPMFTRHLLVWDSLNCHIDNCTKKELKARTVDMAVVPGGCTKFLQPADVFWNKPFKGFLRSQYNEWLATGEITYTKGRNPR